MNTYTVSPKKIYIGWLCPLSSNKDEYKTKPKTSAARSDVVENVANFLKNENTMKPIKIKKTKMNSGIKYSLGIIIYLFYQIKLVIGNTVNYVCGEVY